MGKRYTVADLLARYGMKQSAFSRLLNRHINDINVSGPHVTKDGRSWYFDDAAVQFLDRLRGAFQPQPQASDSSEVLQEEISRLKDVLGNLQHALLVSREELAASRKETADARAETIEVMKDRDDIKKQLSDLSTKYALLEASEETSKRLKEENQNLREQLSGTLRDIQDSVRRSPAPSGKGWNRRGTVRKIKLSTFH